jgi:hypothetical protein
MPEVFDPFTTQQVPAIVAAGGATLVTLALILSVLYYQLRLLADHTALARERQQGEMNIKQELIRRNVPPEDLKKALGALQLGGGDPLAAPPPVPSPSPVPVSSVETDEALRARVVKDLVYMGDDVEPEIIEETVTLVAATDRATLLTLSPLLAEFANLAVDGDKVFATIAAMCKAARQRPAPAPEPAPAPAGESGIDLQFADAIERK